MNPFDDDDAPVRAWVGYMGTRRPAPRAHRRRRRAVLKRDHHVCVYCGAAATTVDHVQPRSQGGPASLTNLVAACAKCNHGRGVRPLTDEELTRAILAIFDPG